MKKFDCTVSTGILETKRCYVYASSVSEAKSKISASGYRLLFSDPREDILTLNGYIDSEERAGQIIVIR